MPPRIRSVERHLAAEWVDRVSEDEKRAVDFLRPQQSAETEALTKMLGRPFPQWTTLYGG